MYIPNSFSATDESALDLIELIGFGQLISIVEDHIEVSYLPVLLDREKKTLVTHAAKLNPHIQALSLNSKVTMTFLGPHGYISPSWYTQNSVPTWNYQAVEVKGEVRVVNDEQELHTLVSKMSRFYENRHTNGAWDAQYNQTMLKHIVGIEISINSIQGKFKLSQNKSNEDVQRVIHKLEENGQYSLSQAMFKQLP